MGELIRFSLESFLSFHLWTATMKAVLALLLICLIKLSLGEEREDVANDASRVGNFLLPRGTRGAARKCQQGDKRQKCRKKLRQEKKRNRTNRRKEKMSTAKKGMKNAKKTSTTNLKSIKKTQRKLQKKRSRKNGRRQKKRLRNGQRKRKDWWPKPTTTTTTVTATATPTTTSTGRPPDQCFWDLVAKTKKFNKAQVELSLAKRIESWGSLMTNKKNNAAFTFSDTLDAMNDATETGTSCKVDTSSLPEAKIVQQKLANCPVSAADHCDQGKLSIPIDSTKVASCKTTLTAFAKDFKDCLTKPTDPEICSCVQGLSDPSADCLNFRAMHDGVKSQREKCTKASFAGSFGDCRKQERMAAKFVNKCKLSCPGGSVSTPSTQRREILLRRLLNQKLNYV